MGRQLSLLWMPNSPPLSDKTIYRQWPRATQDKGSEAGEVQDVSFIAGLPKLCAGSSYGQELDRAEPVGQMHSKHRHEQNHSHR